MWMSLVAMKVWMRGRSESLTAFQAASMSCYARAREAADHRALHLARDRLHRLEVAGRGDREAGLDDVHAEPRELLRDLELLLLVERDPRRLLPVAQGGVEDLYSVRSRCGPRPAPLRRPYLVLLELAAGGRHALFPPKGEKKEKTQVGQARHGAESVHHGSSTTLPTLLRSCR